MARHIAASGARAGQWVTCTAKNCTLGGSHISERDFYAAKAFAIETGKGSKAADITKDVVDEYKKSAVGHEQKWARKAEILARKDKGLRGTNAQVFEGEENLVKVATAKTKFVPNVPKTSKPIPPTQPQQPKTMKIVDIPGVNRYIFTGDRKALQEAVKEWNLDKGEITSVYMARSMMESNFNEPERRANLRYTDRQTGKALKLKEIPEAQSYLNTGNPKDLETLKERYEVGRSSIEGLTGARQFKIDEEAKAQREAKEKVSSEIAEARVTTEALNEPVELSNMNPKISKSPEFRKFLLNGDVEALAEARRKNPQLEKESKNLIYDRVRMESPRYPGYKKVKYTNKQTGEVHAYEDIPEMKEYVATGNKDKIKELEQKYRFRGEGLKHVKTYRKEKLRELKNSQNGTSDKPKPGLFRRIYNKI